MRAILLMSFCFVFVNAYSRDEMYEKMTDFQNIIEKQNLKIEKLERDFEDLLNKRNKESKAMKKDMAVIIEMCRDQHSTRNILGSQTDYLLEDTEMEVGKGLKQKVRDIQENADVATVAFYAYMSHKVSNVGGHHQLVFDVVTTNVGGGYHPSGVFIVPETGLYVFTWSFRVYQGGIHAVELAVNGRRMGVAFSLAPTDDSEQTSATIVISVNKGDDVFLRTGDGNNNGEIFSGPFGYTYFAGWKIN